MRSSSHGSSKAASIALWLAALSFGTISAAGTAVAQGIPMTDVPIIGSDDLSGAPAADAPKEMSLGEVEVNYMIAVGGQSYLKQACGDNSWREDLEKAKGKIKPGNQVSALKGFRSGWNDTRKRFGTNIRSCDKITGGKSQSASNPAAHPDDGAHSLDDLMPEMKAPDLSGAAKSAVGAPDLKLQPTTIKPE